ncbi:MAG: sugar ABC transporter permease [Lachnospiraceae bacterium]|nr:sugar ABC transporter permease [Lachnospiraceae bacterium]
MAIPSATAAFFWQNFFGLHGTLNKFLAAFHITGVDWLNCKYSMLVMVLIFIWKNIGYDMTLFLSGLSNIPEQYYEYADMEGAGRWWKLKHITLTYLMPTTFVVIIMTVVNSFKIFKEIYIMTGEYPPDSLYVLQHYMNNMFLSLNYPKLASATYILTAVIVLFVACIFMAEKKVSENLSS